MYLLADISVFCLLSFLPLSSVLSSSISSPEAVLASPNLLSVSDTFKTSAEPGLQHSQVLAQKMARCLHNKSMIFRCAGGATKHTGCVTVDSLSIYKVSQHQDSPRLWESSVVPMSSSSLVYSFLSGLLFPGTVLIMAQCSKLWQSTWPCVPASTPSHFLHGKG